MEYIKLKCLYVTKIKLVLMRIIWVYIKMIIKILRATTKKLSFIFLKNKKRNQNGIHENKYVT